MIKRIIFDIDETLLKTTEDCINAYNEYFNSIKVKIDGKKLYDLIDKYELNGGNFQKEDLEKYIKKNLYANFNLNDMLAIYSRYGTLKNNKITHALEYLSKKYDIIALTNWYAEVQTNRLDKANISKYFSKVYGIDNNCFKPQEKAFLNACGDYKPSECLMIGDSLKTDIIVPVKLGMNVYYCGTDSNNQYPSIKEINELEELL